mgnify:CR=1 FL=1
MKDKYSAKEILLGLRDELLLIQEHNQNQLEIVLL